MSTPRKLLVGSISRVVLSLAQMAVGFFMMPFLVHNLGDHWYGIWTVVGSTIAYLQMMDLGLSQAVILYLSRYIATQEHDKANRVVNTSMAIYSGLSVGVLVITGVLALFIDRILGTADQSSLVSLAVLVLGASLAIELPFNSFSGIIGAYVRYELLSLVRLFVLIVNTSLTIYFVGQGHGIMALALIQLLSCVLFNTLFYIVSKYCFPGLSVGRRWFDRAIVKDLTHISVWSFLSNLCYLLKYRLDAIVIGVILGPVVVTHYVVGSRLADYFRELLFQATNLSMPILTRYHMLEQQHELRDKLRLLLKINSTLAFFGGGMIMVVGQAFIGTWMGARFLDAYPILIVLICAMIIEVALDPARVALAAMGKNRFIALLELSDAGLKVILSLLLIRPYGMLGVAIGTAIPLIGLKLVVMPRVITRLIPISIGQIYSSILPPAAITAVYLFGYGSLMQHYALTNSYISIALVGIGGIPIYALIAYLLFFDKSEITILRKMLPGQA